MPFTFLNPAFLLALSALAVPLVLHLMRRRRKVHQMISTIRFIQAAQQRSASRMRIRNFLLWLLRTLLLAALVLAFALPVIRLQGTGNILGSAKRDVALIIDSSYSMQYQLRNADVWSKTQEAAFNIINGLNPDDRVCLYQAGSYPLPVIKEPISNHNAVKKAVKNLQPRTQEADLEAALTTACKALKAAGSREREVFILTDGQALPWEGFRKSSAVDETATDTEARQRGPGAWEPELASPDFTIFTLFSGSKSPQNTYINDASVRPRLLMKNSAAKIKTTIKKSGAPQNNTITLLINGRKVNRRSVDIGENKRAEIDFPVSPLPPGKHIAELQLASDSLDIDNTFFLTLKFNRTLPILCVGSDSDTFYIKKALNPSGRNGLSVTQITTKELATENLAKYKTVFLCNALPLKGHAILNLEKYVKKGGILTIFPGNNESREDYEKLDFVKTVFQSVKDTNEDNNIYPVRLLQPDHPLFENLELPTNSVPRIAVKTSLDWENDALDNTQILLSAGRDHPLLVTNDYGSGRVMLFSVSADRGWSTFPITSIFLPVLHRIVRYGANLTDTPAYLEPRETLVLDRILPEFKKDNKLFNPKNEPVKAQATRNNNRQVIAAENISDQGIYEWSKSSAFDKKTAFAVNLRRTESDLTTIRPQVLSELTGLEAINTAETNEELLRLIQENRRGRPLQELFLWLALILAVAEIVVANRLNKQTAPLTSRMPVDHAGKIRSSLTS